ncbi:hypothetical protein BSKO_03482 [Bryopsis sp. KO-2023]|nr:hypothetical protein BSKO_03482 [Bryopsis sp. KO-2023]
MTVMFSGKCIVKAGEIFNAAWEPIASIMKKRGGEKKPDKKDDDADGGKPKPTRSISHAQPLLECHYSINGAFLDEPLIAGVDRIRDIPCIGCKGGWILSAYCACAQRLICRTLGQKWSCM